MDQGKLSHISPPRQIGSTASTRVRLYTASSTASEVHALPVEWQGRQVRVQAEGGDVDWFVSDYAAAAVDPTIVATSAGTADVSLGARLFDGAHDECVIPQTTGVAQYLVRMAVSTSATLRVHVLTER